MEIDLPKTQLGAICDLPESKEHLWLTVQFECDASLFFIQNPLTDEAPSQGQHAA